MAADLTVTAEALKPSARAARPSACPGASWGLVVGGRDDGGDPDLPAVDRALPSRLSRRLIESGTLAALALDATPDNMVTERSSGPCSTMRVDAVVLVEPKPKRALMNIEPRPSMPSYNLQEGASSA